MGFQLNSFHWMLTHFRCLHQVLYRKMDARPAANSGSNGSGRWFAFLKMPKVGGEGWARVVDMLTKGEQQVESYEVKLMRRVSFVSFLIGTYIAGSNEMPWAKQRFKEQHALSLFSSRKEAAVRLNNYMFVTFWKVGCRLGLRMAAFGFSYTFAVACLARYRNCLKMYDFLIGGTLAGAVYRLPRGLRASFAAGLIGLAFSGATVLCMCPLLFFAKMSLDDVYKQIREEHYRQELEAVQKRRALNDIMKRYSVSWWQAKAIWKAEQQNAADGEQD
uniref:Complex I assembly factor TIMMDC1, mitochondrial n=1 Tax=Trichuris muris TaxID=70415 RepID=A0A5S6R649_TRIMR